MLKYNVSSINIFLNKLKSSLLIAYTQTFLAFCHYSIFTAAPLKPVADNDGRF